MRVVAGVLAVVVAAGVACAGPDAPRGNSLDVEVATDDGRPVVGARVDAFEVRPLIAPGGWIHAYGDPMYGGPAATLDEVLDPEHVRRTSDATATSDAAGRAHFDGLAPRRFTFVVMATGRPVERRTVVVPGCNDPLRFTLPEGHALEGRVIDAAGRPFPGALVVASYDALDWWYRGTHVSAFDPRTRTDAEGRYRFDTLPSGSVKIRASPRGTWTTRYDELRIPNVARFDVEVFRGGPIAGVVRDVTTSAPAPGAVVEFGGQSWGAHARVVADAQGRYEVPVWPSDRIDPPEAFAPGMHAAWPEDAREVRLVEGVPVRIDAFVHAGGTLRGRVLCEGRPVADAFVRLGSTERNIVIARTDADGRYASPAMQAGGLACAAFRAERLGQRSAFLFMSARARGDATDDVVVAIPETGAATCDFSLPIPMKPSVRGVVVGPDGEPVGGATVTAPDGVVRKADTEGFFELSETGPPPATFLVAADRFISNCVQAVDDASRTIVVRLARPPDEDRPAARGKTATRTATFRGHVVDAPTKKPVEGARIRLEWSSGSDGPPAEVFATTDAAGAYVVHDARTDDLVVVADAPGFGSDMLVVGPKAGETATADFSLPPAGTMSMDGRVFYPYSPPRGRLVDDWKAPLVGWRVEGYRHVASKRLGPDALVRATTGADGAFEFDAKVRVDHLLAYPPAGVTGGPRAVKPEYAPTGRADGLCTLRGGSIVAIEVVDEDGCVADGYKVRFTNESDGVWRSFELCGGAMACRDKLAPDERVSIHVEMPGFEPIDVSHVPAGTARMRLVLKRKTGK